MWEVYLISTLFGVVNLFDNPARQTFVSEMVGRDLMPNAISLNSVVMNSARVIGPAIGGILIFAVGLAACFLFNAASYVAVLVALFMMRPAELHQRPVVVRAKGQVREGLRYVWSTRELRDPLLAMAVVGIFAFNFTTTLPLLATRTFHGGAGTYSALMAAMGAGAVIGGLMVAHRSRPSTAMLSVIGLAFGVMLLVVAAAPTEVVALVALVFMGLCSISFIATANATIQMQADPAMRGRVMALYAIAFLGSTPIGAPLVGWIADVTNPRVAIMVGGVATLAACIPLAFRYRRDHSSGAASAVEESFPTPNRAKWWTSLPGPSSIAAPTETGRYVTSGLPEPDLIAEELWDSGRRACVQTPAVVPDRPTAHFPVQLVHGRFRERICHCLAAFAVGEPEHCRRRVFLWPRTDRARHGFLGRPRPEWLSSSTGPSKTYCVTFPGASGVAGCTNGRSTNLG